MEGGEPEVTTSTGRAEHVVSGRGDLFDPACPTRQLLDRLGSKWTSMLVKVLADASPEEVRFADLRRLMSGISQKMLSATLQQLVQDGLVGRRVEDTVPPRVHYRLTELGHSLEVPLSALRAWAEEHMSQIDPGRATMDTPEATSRPSPVLQGKPAGGGRTR